MYLERVSTRDGSVDFRTSTSNLSVVTPRGVVLQLSQDTQPFSPGAFHRVGEFDPTKEFLSRLPGIDDIVLLAKNHWETTNERAEREGKPRSGSITRKTALLQVLQSLGKAPQDKAEAETRHVAGLPLGVDTRKFADAMFAQADVPLRSEKTGRAYPKDSKAIKVWRDAHLAGEADPLSNFANARSEQIHLEAGLRVLNMRWEAMDAMQNDDTDPLDMHGVPASNTLARNLRLSAMSENPIKALPVGAEAELATAAAPTHHLVRETHPSMLWEVPDGHPSPLGEDTRSTLYAGHTVEVFRRQDNLDAPKAQALQQAQQRLQENPVPDSTNLPEMPPSHIISRNVGHRLAELLAYSYHLAAAGTDGERLTPDKASRAAAATIYTTGIFLNSLNHLYDHNNH